MKRHSGLYPCICSFENLLRAAYRARRGKRLRPDVAAFHHNLEANLLALRDELQARTYRPGPYRAFVIHDPKTRLISAAPYRDRVVHHALCQVVEPVFERTFIDASYANRKGKGTHKALDRCTYWARRHAYVLKCDIAKYFPSIDHEILLGLVARKIKCTHTLWLLRAIVEHSNLQEEAVAYFPGDDLFAPFGRRRGLPIGNLTSQFLANVYLSPLDHFVLQSLGVRAYVRFCDDFLLFGDDPSDLRRWREEVRAFLCGLRLRLHPSKCQVTPTRCGVPFLGWQVFPDHRLLRGGAKRRMRRRLRVKSRLFAAGVVTEAHLEASLMSTLGHLRHGDAYGLTHRLLAPRCYVVAGPPGKVPWRDAVTCTRERA